jgi:hypothetical protein
MPFVVGIRSEADSVVRDRQMKFVGSSNDIDFDVFGVGMIGDVMQRFLYDSKQTERDVSG